MNSYFYDLVQFTASGMRPGGTVPFAYPASTMVAPGITQVSRTVQ